VQPREATELHFWQRRTLNQNAIGKRSHRSAKLPGISGVLGNVGGEE
jgi:hypothetical protein